MLKFWLLSMAVGLLLSCGNTEKDTDVINNQNSLSGNQSGKEARIEFEAMEKDFGKITLGEKVEHLFVFKNTGEGNLIINEAKADCGCTVPKVPKEPIAPGEKGEIPVEFTPSKTGLNEKIITVTSNANPATTKLKIRADVMAK